MSTFGTEVCELLYSRETTIFVFQGFLQQLRQIAGRMSAGPRGAGLGLKLLIGAGALAYGVKEATYTGNVLYLSTCKHCTPVTHLNSDKLGLAKYTGRLLF